MSDFQDFVAPGDTPVMISLLNGHTAVVHPEPTPLHRRFWKEATRKNCYPHSLAKEIHKVDTDTSSEEQTRTEVIKQAMKKMLDDEDNFTANGLPNANVLASRAGFTVLREERDRIWEIVKEEEGIE